MNLKISALCGVLFAASLVAANPEVGIWKIDLEKSKLANPTSWNGRRMIIEQTGNGRRITFERPMPDGQVQKQVAVRSYDGKESIVEGSAGDTTTTQRIDDFHHRTIFKTKGKQTVVLESTVSPDGKTMTNVFKGTRPNGKAVDEIRVWDRQ
jgi:hypothetical protein